MGCFAGLGRTPPRSILLRRRSFIDSRRRLGFSVPMNFSKEEFLYVLLWGAETLGRPSYQKVFETFEGWAYRRGFLREIRRLENRQLIEAKLGAVERVYRLTEVGRVAALGGRDPEARWGRSWDGRWRFVVFDLPEKHNAARVRLRRYLKDHGFGYLQKSLWVTPDPLDFDVKELSARGDEVESLITVEGSPCSGETDQAIVSGAWNFDLIRGLHEECLRILDLAPNLDGDRPTRVASIRAWAGRERLAWGAAIAADPLLPSALLPPSYLGAEVWGRRNAILRQAAQWLQ